jgi:RNA polymerase sigma-70 factor (ECF subfamily)
MNWCSPELLAQLLDRHGAALALLARQWCGAAEDVVQEAFVRLARQEECPGDPAAWLFRVVRNGAISAGRAESRRRRHEQVASAAARGWFEDEADAMIDAQAAADALAQVPLDEREIIVAHVWGGLTFGQIAELFESSSSTVHRKYQAGLVALRELLGETCLPIGREKNCPKN